MPDLRATYFYIWYTELNVSEIGKVCSEALIFFLEALKRN